MTWYTDYNPKTNNGLVMGFRAAWCDDLWRMELLRDDASVQLVASWIDYARVCGLDRTE